MNPLTDEKRQIDGCTLVLICIIWRTHDSLWHHIMFSMRRFTKAGEGQSEGEPWHHLIPLWVHVYFYVDWFLTFALICVSQTRRHTRRKELSCCPHQRTIGASKNEATGCLQYVQTIDLTCRQGGIKNNTLLQLSAAWLAGSSSAGQSSTRYSNRSTAGEVSGKHKHGVGLNADREQQAEIWNESRVERHICQRDTSSILFSESTQVLKRVTNMMHGFLE